MNTSAFNNPFGITKSNDLTDQQINTLWVDVSGNETIYSLARPASTMPMFILGGKGSGKTHLMRYCSFPVQRLRYKQQGHTLESGITQDGYIGIYWKCSGLNSERFNGKGISPETWSDLFSFYLELWFAAATLQIIKDSFEEYNAEAETEHEVCKLIAECFDANEPDNFTFLGIIEHIKNIQKRLDHAINNASFTNTIDERITVTRGNLIFGIPKILCQKIRALKPIIFVYQLDEFENLSREQQKYINTLIREKEPPVTFKIGARLYGVKTHQTLSGGEENVQGSEFEELRIDERFRHNKDSYKELTRLLIAKRLQQANINISSSNQKEVNRWLDNSFSNDDWAWNSPIYQHLLLDAPSSEREHFVQFKKKLEMGIHYKTVGDLTSKECEEIYSLLAVEKYPLLEKVNLSLFYKAWANQENLYKEAHTINKACSLFINEDSRADSYKQRLKHFRSDLIAQLLRENRKHLVYSGLNSFISISDGLPRALITILKHIYDWSLFKRESPFNQGQISVEAQQRGIREASEWFLESMRKAGSDGTAIKISIERLATLLRINRFSDKPIECSLMGFSVDNVSISKTAEHILDMAEQRSFLVNIAGGQRERNSNRITAKLQLNRMLAPRWDLPVTIGGTATFSEKEINIIFDPAKTQEFDELQKEWLAKMNAPWFGRKKTKNPKTFMIPESKDLFEP